MSELIQFLDERISEVRDYIELLRAIEQEAATGVPRLEQSKAPITVSQQRVLASTVYLQLYSLTEALVSRCLEALGGALETGGWQPTDLAEQLKREWVRHMARTHTEMSPERRLENAMILCEHLMGQLPLGKFAIDVGGGGNWDDEEIYRLGQRLGCNFRFAAETQAAAKRPIRDSLGALKLVRDRRNRLAHGSLSFRECADGVATDELTRTTDALEAYVREFVSSFIVFIESHMFVLEDRRPSQEAG
ncbi:MAE_28990/MAE_18760 family HEPN-like nuclease [Actinomycetospora sp. OC33-EN08]|uniref:MAE_28990/MAE_18760 family HEPN-like nuclease n=1 Tax=Actinomycetospora aurantiaca TaxID=3129233 RepID=A0ABU8MHD5_9PSEU